MATNVVLLKDELFKLKDEELKRIYKFYNETLTEIVRQKNNLATKDTELLYQAFEIPLEQVLSIISDERNKRFNAACKEDPYA